MSKQLPLMMISLVGILCLTAGPLFAQNSAAPAAAQPTTAVDNGPLGPERQQIRDLIQQASQNGKNVTNYVAAQSYIEQRVKAGAQAGELNRTANQLISQLKDEINDVKHAPIVIQHVETTATAGQKNQHSGKSAADEYSAELNKQRRQKENEYKKGMSKEFWQKFHDEMHKPKQR